MNRKILSEAKKNANMYRKIAEVERENKEGFVKGDMSSTFQTLANKTTKVAANAAVEDDGKKAREILGSAKTQARRPT